MNAGRAVQIIKDFLYSSGSDIHISVSGLIPSTDSEFSAFLSGQGFSYTYSAMPLVSLNFSVPVRISMVIDGTGLSLSVSGITIDQQRIILVDAYSESDRQYNLEDVEFLEIVPGGQLERRISDLKKLLDSIGD